MVPCCPKEQCCLCSAPTAAAYERLLLQDRAQEQDSIDSSFTSDAGVVIATGGVATAQHHTLSLGPWITPSKVPDALYYLPVDDSYPTVWADADVAMK